LSKLFDTYDFSLKINRNKFSYEKCLSCESVQLKNVPGNLKKYYPENYDPYNEKKDNIVNNKIFQSRLKILRKYKNIKNILEIGSGDGAFAIMAKKNGFDVSCVEINDKFNKNLKKNNINIINKRIEDLNSNDFKSKFDCIVAFHLIEHVDINSFIEIITRLSKKKSIIFIITPNIESLSFRIFKRFWFHIDAPRHINLPSKKILNKLMNSAGFSKQKEIRISYDNFMSNKYGWDVSGYYMYKYFNNKLYSRISKVAGIIMPFIELFINISAQISVIYQKKN
jgi:2-polyprenyl-3-methyl-5-hydroxy-6-metoxy-1,4-benzoquinol methylase